MSENGDAPHPTLYWEKVYDEVGHLTPLFAYRAIRFWCACVGNLDYKRITRFGAHECAIRASEIFRKMTEDYKVLKKNHIGSFFTLGCKNMRKLMQFIR